MSTQMRRERNCVRNVDIVMDLMKISHYHDSPPTISGLHHNQQPPERVILSHIDCFSQYEIMGLEVIQDCLHPCD